MPRPIYKPDDPLADAFLSMLLETPGEMPTRDGLAETPDRAAKAWREMTGGYQLDVKEVFKTFDGDGYDELVLLRDIPFTSLCEHHLLPFIGHAHIGYIAEGKIIGLSKLARLLDIFARRLQVQERLGKQVADALQDHLDPKGVIVLIEAEHLCMSVRGVKKPGARTITSVIRGAFKENDATRAEVMALIR